MAAYFAMLNDQGGINGRKVDFVSLDDGYSPPKTVEQTRRLVEQEGVLMIYGSVGTAHATAVHKYLNRKRVPQLFIRVALAAIAVVGLAGAGAAGRRIRAERGTP